jgi:hypothetical protein
MHQSTQRRFCRVVFLAGCILPTLAVMAWATYERLPSTMTSRLATIEHALAVRVRADSVITPTPGTFRAEGVEITNLETGEVVLAATTATYESLDAGSLIRLTGVELTEHELTHLASKLHDVLEVDWPDSVRVEVSDVRWRGEASPAATTLVARKRLQLVLDSTDAGGVVTGRKLTIQLGTDGARLEVDRNRQVSPPATSVCVDTVGKGVPAPWLIALGAVVVDGGELATFTGKMNVVHAGSLTSGSAMGSLENVGLAEATGLPIAATGSIRNLELSWRDSRVELARGVLTASAGSMAGSLARAMQDLYQEQQLGSTVAENESVAFTSLGVWFQLNSESFSLWGACPTHDSTRCSCMVGTNSEELFGPPSWSAHLSRVAMVLGSFGSDSATQMTARLPRAVRR